MKYVFILYFLSLCICVHAQDDVKGIWKGKLTQDKGGYLSLYWFEIHVHSQEGEVLKGITRIGDPNDDSVRGQFRFTGTYIKNQFAFRELKLDEEAIAEGYGWCYKVGVLNLTKHSSQWQLEGRWEGKRRKKGICTPGSIQVILPKSPELTLILSAKDSLTQEKINPKFQCFNAKNEQIFSLNNHVFGLETQQKYYIKTILEGYYPHTSEVYFNAPDTVTKEVLLKPIRVNDIIQIESVYFKRSKAELLKTSYKTLNDWIDFLRKNPSLKIEICGHTDNIGNASLNQKLSVNRAKKIYTYFIEYGIEKERLTYQGYGGTKPISSNTTESGRQQNRRVEFRVLVN